MNPISLSSIDHVATAIRSSRSAEISAFVLDDAKSAVPDALAAAAANGAEVDVHLAGDSFARSIRPLDAANRRTAAHVRHAGGHVDFNTGRGSPATPLHAKLALVDGVGYLDERNWNDAGDTVIRDARPDDLAVIRGGLAGKDVSDDRLAVRKAKALAMEVDYLKKAPGRDLSVETESFGPGPVADAVDARAKDGTHVRLDVVKAYTRPSSMTELRRLASDGVDVRLNPEMGAEKVAFGAGDAIWVGSSNATKGRADQIDWGMRLSDHAIAESLKHNFEQRWAASVPLATA